MVYFNSYQIPFCGNKSTENFCATDFHFFFQNSQKTKKETNPTKINGLQKFMGLGVPSFR